MHTRKFWILCAVFLIPALTMSHPIDSLYHSWQKEKTVANANQLIRLLDKEGYADSLYIFTEKQNPEEISMHLLSNVAYFYYANARYSESVQLTNNVILHAGNLKDTLALSDNFFHLGSCYQRLGNLEMGIKAMLQALEMDERIQDMSRLSSTYNNLAALFLSANRYESARQYIDHAIELELALEKPKKLSIRYGIAAEIYGKLKLYPAALNLAQKAYELDKAAGDTLKMARRQSQMGDIYSAMNQSEKAEQLYLKASELFEQIGERTSLAINYKQLGSFFIAQQRISDAVQYLKKSEELAVLTGNQYLLQQVYEKFYQIYKEKNPRLSLDFLEKSTSIKDSLYTERTNRLLSDYQIKYETGQKEETIVEQELALKVQRYWLFSLVVGLLFVAFLAVVFFLYFTRYKNLARREQLLNWQKERLITILSHDIKNPLVMLTAMMRVFVQNIDKGQTEGLKEQSHQLLKSVRQQLVLVENLLAWAKLQSQRWKVVLIPIDLRSVVQEVEKQLDLTLKEKDCQLVKEFPSDRMVAFSDRQMTVIVIRNLVHNAIKYSYPKGMITLEISEQENDWLISVHDEGVGLKVDPKDLLNENHVGHSIKGTAGESGSGTGLAICREMLKLCHGSVSVAPGKNGRGTSVRITLPKAS